MARTGASLANEQSTDALGDELQGVHLKARLTWHFEVKAPVKVCQREALVQT